MASFWASVCARVHVLAIKTIPDRLPSSLSAAPRWPLRGSSFCAPASAPSGTPNRRRLAAAAPTRLQLAPRLPARAAHWGAQKHRWRQRNPAAAKGRAPAVLRAQQQRRKGGDNVRGEAAAAAAVRALFEKAGDVVKGRERHGDTKGGGACRGAAVGGADFHLQHAEADRVIGGGRGLPNAVRPVVEVRARERRVEGGGVEGFHKSGGGDRRIHKE